MSEFVPRFEILAAGVLAAVFVGLLVIETRFPLRKTKRPKAGRFAINVTVSGLALAIGAYVVAPVAFSLSARSAKESFGLLHLVPLPFPTEFVLGFLLMDLTFLLLASGQSYIFILLALS